jgi:isoleucyl-tRNA synthetase
VPLVDLQGNSLSAGEYAGKYVKTNIITMEAPERSVDVEIAIKEENKAFKVEKYVHSYPHCWRTDKPILYYPLDSWFIKSRVRDRMFDFERNHQLEAKIDWRRTFWNWIKNANDWNLSRSRFGNSITNLENRRQTRRNLVVQLKNYTTKSKNQSAAGFQRTLSKV